MEKLHPKGIWLFRIPAFFFTCFLFFVTFILVAVFASAVADISAGAAIGVIIGYFLLGIVSIFIITETYSRMAYNRWFYEFGEDSIRLERGIIWKQYSNIPYARIQNIDITRGIIARMFGFSTIRIQTAGYSAVPGAEGSIPAVDAQKAEEIRDMLMKKISKQKK